MITTKIKLTPYLAEYITGLYNKGVSEAVTIPNNSDLYHVVWDLMVKRPANLSAIDSGNLVLALPDRRIGKDPVYYNYLSQRSQKTIERKIRAMFNADLHQRLDENMNATPKDTNLETVRRFLSEYKIESVSEEALLKNYYRWRQSNRKRKKRLYLKRKFAKMLY